jgi:hypothetical protein
MSLKCHSGHHGNLGSSTRRATKPSISSNVFPAIPLWVKLPERYIEADWRIPPRLGVPAREEGYLNEQNEPIE